MRPISFTTFLDFLSAQTVGRVGLVRKAIDEQGPYNPAFDYWRRLRDAIVSFEKGELSISQLRALPSEVTERKRANYKASLAAYLQWRQQNPGEWFEPPRRSWTHGGLSIRVRAEIGIEGPADSKVVKLYFKAEPLTARRLGAALHLLRVAYRRDRGIVPVILDVSRGRHYEGAALTGDQRILLNADAAHFMAIWAELGGPA